MLRSIDFVSKEDKMHHTYPAKFLQQLNSSRLSPTLLCLKVGYPVILLRNLDLGEGLCNGTRIVVLNMRRKVLQYRIISKNRRFREKVVLIPRIRLSPNTETLPVPLKRLQFPVRLYKNLDCNALKLLLVWVDKKNSIESSFDCYTLLIHILYLLLFIKFHTSSLSHSLLYIHWFPNSIKRKRKRKEIIT